MIGCHRLPSATGNSSPVALYLMNPAYSELFSRYRAAYVDHGLPLEVTNPAAFRSSAMPRIDLGLLAVKSANARWMASACSGICAPSFVEPNGVQPERTGIPSARRRSFERLVRSALRLASKRASPASIV